MRELLDSPGFIALFGTIFGGIGLKVAEHLLGNQKRKVDIGTTLRDELRKEIDSLRQQLAHAATEEQRLEALVDRWQGAYWDLRDEKQRIVTELTLVMDRLKRLEQTAIQDDE